MHAYHNLISYGGEPQPIRLGHRGTHLSSTHEPTCETLSILDILIFCKIYTADKPKSSWHLSHILNERELIVVSFLFYYRNELRSSVALKATPVWPVFVMRWNKKFLTIHKKYPLNYCFHFRLKRLDNTDKPCNKKNKYLGMCFVLNFSFKCLALPDALLWQAHNILNESRVMFEIFYET